MLTLLSTLKLRLAIPEIDTTQDALLTFAIEAVSARFDQECNRTLARTVDFQQEFPADANEIVARCHPVETVTRFETKATEAAGWEEQTAPGFLVRSKCVISLEQALESGWLGRVTYPGGFVLPGHTPGPGQTPLPRDLEHAAIEQAAAWFLNRDKVGLLRHWPSAGTYILLAQGPLLPAVAAILNRYRRWKI